MSKMELKPCRCGSENLLIDAMLFLRYPHAVRCLDCQACTDWRASLGEAVADWNEGRVRKPTGQEGQ